MTSSWDSPGVAENTEAYWNNPEIDTFRRQIADWIGMQTGKLLDLGCGTARMSSFLKGPYYYVGLDSSEEMLKIAQTRITDRAQLYLGDFREGLLFPDKSFAAALCMEVIRHLTSYDVVLEGLARVVKKRVYIVDAFQYGQQHQLGTVESSDIPDNRWSFPLFLADAARYFPGWDIEYREFRNDAMGVKIEVPK